MRHGRRLLFLDSVFHPHRCVLLSVPNGGEEVTSLKDEELAGLVICQATGYVSDTG